MCGLPPSRSFEGQEPFSQNHSTQTAATKGGMSHEPSPSCVKKAAPQNNNAVWIKNDKIYWSKANVITPAKEGIVQVQVSTSNDSSCSSSSVSTTNNIRSIRLKEYRGLRLPIQNGNVPDNLLHLEHVHEPGVFEALSQRYKRQHIYTRSGDILLAVNPFQILHPLYTRQQQQLYATSILNQRGGRDPRDTLEPHIYEVSALAYKGLLRHDKDQSIVLSGDSGSGKTTSYKLLLHHLATLQSNHSETITQNIEAANPVLEAFGNAATIHNDNSSRFGKFTQLQYRNHRLVGSQTTTFLLEAARITNCVSIERNYHVFYLLLDCPFKSQIDPALTNSNASDYSYLGATRLTGIEGTSDGECFEQSYNTLQSMQIDVKLLFQTVAAVLHLGNVPIVANPQNDHACIAHTNNELQIVCRLLGLKANDLVTALTIRSYSANNERYQVPLSVQATMTARDALAKALYTGTFDWLVRALNRKTMASDATRTIGLLDIFGFESLQTNRFGQLCINYANEKLQQQAVQTIFQASKVEYEREGIPFHHVDYQDNERVLRLIEGRNGLVDILLEECFRPQGNHRALVQKLLACDSTYALAVKGRENEFKIVHFAGTVTYEANDFVASNQDKLPDDVKELCRNASTNGIVSEIFSVTEPPPNVRGRSKDGPANELKLRPSVNKPQNDKDVDQHASWIKKEASPFSVTQTNRDYDACRKKERSDKFPTVSRFFGDDVHKVPVSASMDKRIDSDSWIKMERVESIDRSTSFDDSLSTQSQAPRRFKNISPSRTVSRVSNAGRSNAATRSPPKRSTSSDIVGDTIWAKYQDQLSSLLGVLSITHCRYVRCIKPNEEQKPGIVDQKMVIEKLRCAGVVATVRLSRSIYPASMKNVIVRFRFGQLWDKQRHPSKARSFQRVDIRRKKECEALLESAFASRDSHNADSVQGHSYVVGKTRTYFAAGALEYLEAQRVRHLDNVAVAIQRRFRGNLSRKASQSYCESRRASAIALQSRIRVFLCHKAIERSRREQHNAAAATKIEKWYRLHLTTCIHSKNIEAAIAIQRCTRGYLDRRYCNDIRRAATTLRQALCIRNVRQLQRLRHYEKTFSLIALTTSQSKDEQHNN